MTEYECQSWTVDAPLTAVAVDRGGTLAAFAGGDGAARLLPLIADEADLRLEVLTDGAVLCLVPDCQDGSFLAGADDRTVYRIDADGHTPLLRLSRAWPDLLATHPAGMRAVVDGPDVHLLDRHGKADGTLTAHPSTLAGMAFDRAGLHLVVSHYDGATIWDLSARSRTHTLHHRGSHLNLCLHPRRRYVVTTTQEKELHAWDLQTGTDVSLGPCFSKVKTLGWSADGQWLLASGNDTISAWSFADGLPLPAAKMLGRFSEDLIDQVRPHPILALAAVGYNDGGLELTAISARSNRHALIEPPAAPVAAMEWSPDGNHLVGGCQDGRLFAYRFDAAWLARLSEEN